MADSGTAAFGEEHYRQWTRLVDQVREMMNQVVKLDTDAARYGALADDIAALNRALAVYATGRPIPQFDMHADVMSDTQQLRRIMRFNPVCGELNPIAPNFVFKRDGEKLIAEVNFPAVYEGPPGCVHGGVVSMMYDQLLSNVAIFSGKAGPTASLTIHYRRPTPLHTDLRFASWVEGIDGRKISVRGECRAGDAVVTEAEGLFIDLGEGAYSDQ